MVAAGMLVSLWLWASQNVTNGDLSGCSDRAIAEAAEYRKKPDVFVKALIKTKWLDEDRKLHDWEEYATLLNDCAERQKENTRERVKRCRERKKAAAAANAVQCGNATCNVTNAKTPASETLGNAPTLPNHTLPYLTNDITGAAGDTAREETDSGLLSTIGLKPGEYIVTVAQVAKTIEDTDRLFRKFRKDARPVELDRRMVFILSSHSPDAYGLLEYAFEQAQTAGKVNDWRYIAGIMRVLASRGITTVEQAKEWDTERPDLSGEEDQTVMDNLLRKLGAEA